MSTDMKTEGNSGPKSAPIRQANADPILLRTHDAAEALSIGVSTLHEWESTGKLGPEKRKVGAVSGYLYRELLAWAVSHMPPRHVWLKFRPPEFRPVAGAVGLQRAGVGGVR